MSYPDSSQISLLRGESRNLQYTISDFEGTLLDLSDYSLVFTVKARAGAVLTLTVGSGITIIDAALGRCDVLLSSANTLLLSTNTVYNTYLAMTRTSDSQVSFPVQGSLNIKEGM